MEPSQAAGFVTFTSSKAMSAAARQHHVPALNTMDVKPAPEPRDVWWDNLDINFLIRELRETLVSVAVFFLVFFWSVPVVFVQGLTTMEKLSETLPFLEPIVDLDPAIRCVSFLIEFQVLNGTAVNSHYSPLTFEFFFSLRGHTPGASSRASCLRWRLSSSWLSCL